MKTKVPVNDGSEKAFRARYWDEEMKVVVGMIFSDSTLESAQEYAAQHAGSRVLLDVKEFTNWLEAALSDDSDILKK